MELYNTLDRAVTDFVPIHEGRVTVYVCGPTVQSSPHLGHGRSAVSFDVLRRYLEWSGYDVMFVRNVTDIDDKIIDRAKAAGTTTDEIARESFVAFSSAYRSLGNLEPTIEPRATDHVGEMIALVELLIDSGHAYKSDGDVYFAVRSFPSYGKLSRHNVDDLRSGERIEPDERKRDPLDFALWKAAKPGEPEWDSPWGKGRPGWHIECSAMSSKYLGQPFDIHTGGSDLIFPHHENEIAQSEAAHGIPMANYWLHNGMLNLSGEKMAKSTGHVVTLHEALERWDPIAVRLFYLRTHYRKPLEFSESALDDAAASLSRLRSFRRRADRFLEGDADAEAIERFREAMDRDLDTAGALAVVFDVVRAGNTVMDEGGDATGHVLAFDEMMDVLGLVGDLDGKGDVDVSQIAADFGVPGATIDDLVELRTTLRAEKDWARADALRDRLAAVGITIEDSADGSTWHRS